MQFFILYLNYTLKKERIVLWYKKFKINSHKNFGTFLGETYFRSMFQRGKRENTIGVEDIKIENDTTGQIVYII